MAEGERWPNNLVVDVTLGERSSLGRRYIERRRRVVERTEQIADPQIRHQIYRRVIEDIVEDLKPLVPEGKNPYWAVYISLLEEAEAEEDPPKTPIPGIC